MPNQSQNPSMKGSTLGNVKNSNSLVLYEFTWKHGGDKIILTGSFDEWKQTVVMKPDLADNTVFKAVVPLDPTKTHQFKYVIDGIWRCSLDFPTVTDNVGNVNNVLHPEAIARGAVQPGPLAYTRVGLKTGGGREDGVEFDGSVPTIAPNGRR